MSLYSQRSRLTTLKVDDEESEEETRPRQRRNRDESDQEIVSDDAPEPPRATQGSQTLQTADGQMAKRLVRYALSCEFSRTPIRRDGIKERGEFEDDPGFRRTTLTHPLSSGHTRPLLQKDIRPCTEAVT